MSTKSRRTSDASVKVVRLGVDGFISSPLIKVLVGPESQRSELFVHQSIITSRSKFFASALSGRWNNSDAKTVSLYDVDPELRLEDVEHYLEAVYTNRMTLKDDSSVLERICHVYVIAELLLDLQTRNLATRALYEQICRPISYPYVAHTYPSPECIKIIYKGTVDGDLMRDLLVHSSCGIGGHSLLQCDDLPEQFLSELATVAAPRVYHKPGPVEPLLYHLEVYLEDDS